MKHFLLLAVLFCSCSLLSAAELPLPDANGTYAATDALGRVLPLPKDPTLPETPRKDRYVGIFYFLWLAQHGKNGPFDITKIVTEHPDAVQNADHPAWGPVNAFHHWGEPLYGYYTSEDAWVMRKHIQLLTDAGVDFLVFDATNASHYQTPSLTMLKILDEYQKQGWNVPKIVYYTNSHSGATAEKIYRDIYSKTEYKDLWFYWEGKPLLIAQPEECSDEVKQFFRIKKSQWPNEGKYHDDGFPWIAFEQPQHVFKNKSGENEVISVSVAQHAGTTRFSSSAFYGNQTNWTRSWHGGKNDPAKDAFLYGYNIAEQFEYALKQDPKIIFVTGWNEWIAMRFKNMVPNEPVGFVDLCDTNNSRDIEPMKGGFGDNYYIQLLGNIRRFKGAAPQRQPKIVRKGNTATVYRDYTNDIVNRSAAGYGTLVYENTTGLNDFEQMEIAYDENNVYFYVQTVNAIRDANADNRMTLYLDIPHDTATPTWNGYSFVLNRTGGDGQRLVLERCRGGWDWEQAGTVAYRIEGNRMDAAVPRALLGLKGKPVRIHFKWSDAAAMDGTIIPFYTDGDAAPLGRANYVFEE